MLGVHELLNFSIMFLEISIDSETEETLYIEHCETANDIRAFGIHQMLYLEWKKSQML